MKKTDTLHLAALLACGLVAGSASGQSTFQITYGDANTIYANDYANTVAYTAGGYVLSGLHYISNIYGDDAFLMKINPDGDILWQKTYGLTTNLTTVSHEEFYHLVEANDGGLLAGGTSNWAGNTDMFVLKTDSEGNPQWQKRIGIFSTQYDEQVLHVLPVPGGYVLSCSVLKFQEYDDAVMIRIDEDGNVVWSQRYSSNPANTRLLAQYIRGDTLFASGYRDNAGAFVTIDANTGNLISVLTLDGSDTYEKSLESMAEVANGDFLLAGHVISLTGNPVKQWVCRVSSSGELIWSKTYPGVGKGPIIPLSDGNFMLTPVNRALFQNSVRDATLLKIDGNGSVIWSYKYGQAGADLFTSALETTEGGILAQGWIKTLGIPQNVGEIMIVKTDSSGRVAGCCRQQVDTAPELYQTGIQPAGLTETAYVETMDAVLHTAPLFNSVLGFCQAGPPGEISQTFFICPGDSVLIDGVYYTAPGTVVDTIAGPACDTVFTSIIQYADPGNISVVDVQCPADKVVQAPAGAASAVVDYDAPEAFSDCLCPGVGLALTQGLPSGSAFPVGVHDLCFEGQDHCGNTASCCFQISVIEDIAEAACDEKKNGCITFELLRITRDAQWNRTYHIRVTNDCNQPLTYTAFQLPDGVTADAPANNGTYAAPGGNTYAVRNPNHSPFHSIRFTPQGTGIQSGGSDVFRYTLPPQSAPAYIHAAVKTGPSSYAEAHLNTFNCPVEFDPGAQKPADERRDEADTSALFLFPNPASGVLFADLDARAGETIQIRIFSAQGKTVLAEQMEAGGRVVRVDLPAGMAPGLYLFTGTFSDGTQRTGRVVVR